MGQPAARVGDMHVCPMVTPGVPPIPHVGGPILPPGGITVLIGGMPAAVVGNMCVCVGPPDSIVKGSLGVFICGMPAARMGDMTAHGGTIVVGFPTVLIGDIGGGGGGSVPSSALSSFIKKIIATLEESIKTDTQNAVEKEMNAILKKVNAKKGTDNCGHIIDGVVAALTGKGIKTVSTEQDGSFDAIDARLGSKTDFTNPTSFEDIFADLKKSEPGSMRVIGVDYGDGKSHVIIAVNVKGTVGIMEGQQNIGFITDPAVANKIYNANKKSTIASSPVTKTTSGIVEYKKDGTAPLGVLSTIEKEAAKSVASKLVSTAKEAEANITAILSDIAQKSSAKMEGLEYRLKSVESLTRKLETAAAASVEVGASANYADALKSESESVRDVLRYTFVTDEKKYTDSYDKAVKEMESKGYSLVKSKNTWEKGSPYKGINASFKSPDGQVFELQFHTAQSLATKQATHELYEEFRLSTTSSSRKAELSSIMAEISDGIPTPNGVDKIK